MVVLRHDKSIRPDSESPRGNLNNASADALLGWQHPSGYANQQKQSIDLHRDQNTFKYLQTLQRIITQRQKTRTHAHTHTHTLTHIDTYTHRNKKTEMLEKKPKHRHTKITQFNMIFSFLVNPSACYAETLSSFCVKMYQGLRPELGCSSLLSKGLSFEPV